MNDQEFHSIINKYRENPSCEHASEVRKMAAAYLLDQRTKGTPIAGIGPFLGMMDALKQSHSHDFGLLLSLVCWWMRRALKPERPGWNDYWMARWLMSHDRDALQEIHMRAAGHNLRNLDPVKWSPVVETASWMAASYRQQDSAFDNQLKQIEATCPVCNGGLAA